MTALAPTLQAFFTDGWPGSGMPARTPSPHTGTRCGSCSASPGSETGKAPPSWTSADLDAPLIAAFLDHLEHDRHNSVRTRNTRLAAIRSLFRYAALRHPEHAGIIARVLAIPPKRCAKALIAYLTAAELAALLAAPDLTRGPAGATVPCSAGRPDRAARLRAHQPQPPTSSLGAGAHVHCTGKGRKERADPLTAHRGRAAVGWPNAADEPADPLFPTSTGRRLSRDAVERRHPRTPLPPPRPCPSLRAKTSTPPRPASHAAMCLAARRRRHLGHRPVARPRRHPRDERLPPCGHDHQGTSARPHHASQRPPRPLPPA